MMPTPSIPRTPPHLLARLVVGPLLFLALGCAVAGPPAAAAGPLGPGDHRVVLERPLEGSSATRERVAWVHVPEALTEPAPLVLMLHGYGGTGRSLLRRSSWVAAADDAGFVVAFPEGLRKDMSRRPSLLWNGQGWNDGSGRGFWGEPASKVDDVGFLEALIDDLLGRLPLDPDRVYVSGHSFGASMTYRLGNELSGKLAAVAPYAGAMWAEAPTFEAPLPLMFMVGSEDGLTPPEGGPMGRGENRRIKPPTRRAVRLWAERLGARPDPVAEESNGVLVERWEGGAAEVVHVEIRGLGHGWPGESSLLPERVIGPERLDVDGTAMIWEFFSDKRRPRERG